MWKNWIIGFCRWRCQRLEKAMAMWMNIAYRAENGDWPPPLPEYDE